MPIIMRSAECEALGHFVPIVFAFRSAKHIAYEVHIASSDISHPKGIKGSSLAGILQFVRTNTVRDGSIRPASKDGKFYYITYRKDELYLLRYAQVRTLQFF